MLELNDICKTFIKRGVAVQAVQGVTISAAAGDVLGILGPNGAGKTTLMRLLTTALRPTAGTGRILGYDLLASASDVRSAVGFVSGQFSLYNKLTGVEYLEYFGALNGMRRVEIKDRIDELATRFKMGEFLGRRCADYSAGMRQKISIGRAILHRPQILLLDEATSNLDVDASAELVQLVKTYSESGATVVYTTHRLPEIERLCNKLLIMNSGRMVFFDHIDALRLLGSQSIEEIYAELLHASRQN